MDFSLKQAMGVLVVIAVSALVLVTAVSITNKNNDEATNRVNQMWQEADANPGA